MLPTKRKRPLKKKVDDEPVKRPRLLSKDSALNLPPETWAQIFQDATPKDLAAVAQAGDAHPGSQVARKRLEEDSRIVLIKKQFELLLKIRETLPVGIDSERGGWRSRGPAPKSLPVELTQGLYLGIALTRQCPWLLEEAATKTLRFVTGSDDAVFKHEFFKSGSQRTGRVSQGISIVVTPGEEFEKRLVSVRVKREKLKWGSRAPHLISDFFTNFGFVVKID